MSLIPAETFQCRITAILLTSIVCIAVATSAKAQTENADGKSVSQELERLANALKTTQLQVEQSQQQIQQMQTEIDHLRAQLASKENLPNSSLAPVSPQTATVPSEIAERTSEDTEDIDILRSLSAQQQQTKVESSSRLPVRLTGLLLFNAFANRGKVDQIDLPSSALTPSTTSSNNSTGAGIRQTILGLEGTGPVLAGARTSGHISMDFYGGVTGSATSGPAGTARLRTAGITAAWAHDTLEANYDTPLISPLSPESFATVAQPALAWSGNLWTWAPQFLWTHSFKLRQTDRTLSLKLGLLDTQTLGASDSTQRSTSAGEASGQPSYETRLAYRSGKEEHFVELGIGGLYGKRNYQGNQRVDTWAITADWRIPFGSRMGLSGEFYRGRGLGDLGGGAYRNVVTYNFPNSTATYLRALDAEGGWLQWTYKFSSTLHANAFAGQDSASGNEFRNSNPLSSSNPIFYYPRNRSIVGNLIFRPWSSIIISPEYRHLQSWPSIGSVDQVNIYTLTFGYQF